MNKYSIKINSIKPMRKLIYLISAVFILLSSCAKTEIVNEIYIPSQHNEICFSSGVGRPAHTRAIIEGNEYDETFEFWVMGWGGYYVSGAVGNVSQVQDKVAYDANYNTWRTVNRTYFWKFDGDNAISEPMDFFAIHPANVDFTGYNVGFPCAVIEHDNDISGTNDQIATMPAATPGKTVGAQTDLMTSFVDNATARRTNAAHPNFVDVDNSAADPAHGSEDQPHGTATDNTINFKFHHEFAQIKFQARTVAKNHITIKIKKLEFIVPYTKGEVATHGCPTTTNASYKSVWDFTNTPAEDTNYDYVVLEENSATNDINYAVKLVNTNNSQNPGWTDLTYHYTKFDETTATSENHNILVIPQSLNGLTDNVMIRVTYDVINTMPLNTDGSFTNVTKEVNLSTVRGNGNPDKWEAGKIYTYRLDVNLYEILFSATVEDWVDVNSSGYIFY